MTTEHINIDEVKSASVGRWRTQICPALGISIRNDGKHGPCPICGGKDRFRFDDRDGRGTSFCNQCEPQGRDGFQLVQDFFKCQFIQAVKFVGNVLADSLPGKAPHGRVLVPHNRVHEICSSLSPDCGTIASYLRQRGLSGQVLPALQLHPALTYWRSGVKSPIPMGRYPAIVAFIVDVQGCRLGVHVTYLKKDGTSKADVPEARKTFKEAERLVGGAIHLTQFSSEQPLLLTEGIETALALHESIGLPVWACVSASGLASVEVPQNVKTILIAADLDQSEAGERAANKAAMRLRKRGHVVHVIVPTGPLSHGAKSMDWLDVLNKSGKESLWEPFRSKLHCSQGGNNAQLHIPPELAYEPNILARFEQAMRACGVVGEERCAKLTYLALTSRLLADPVSLVIKGLSSSGKSFTTDTTLSFFPETTYIAMTAMSERALIYMKEDFSHKTIVLFEATALRQQRDNGDCNLTAYFVRSLISEGQIKYPVTMRDKEGGFITKTIIKQGPTNLILTTTATELHGENETRLLSVPTNDSPEQTKAVMLRLAKGKSQEIDMKAWHSLQAWLEHANHQVVIPFATAIAESIRPVAVRLRRDFKSLLRLIEAHTILHQCTRPRDAHGRIVATLDDYLEVRTLIADIVASGVGATVAESVRATVQAVRDADLGNGVTVQDVARRLEVDRSAAQRRLSTAKGYGYLANLESRQYKPARYTIGDPLPEEQNLLPLDLSAYLHPNIARDVSSQKQLIDPNLDGCREGVQVCTKSEGKDVNKAQDNIAIKVSAEPLKGIEVRHVNFEGTISKPSAQSVLGTAQAQ